MTEEKIIDLMIECLDLMSSYVPTPGAPANPALPLIRTKVEALKVIRLKSKKRFALHFEDMVKVADKISSINLKT